MNVYIWRDAGDAVFGIAPEEVTGTDKQGPGMPEGIPGMQDLQ